MYVLRSVCRCGLHSQGLIKQITMGKPVWKSKMNSVSSIQGVYVQVRNLATKDEVDENVKKFRSGNYETIPDPQRLQHFKKSHGNDSTIPKDETPPIGANALPHPIWMTYYTVKLMRGTFDILSGFNRGERNERKWVLRICFLETVAGVPDSEEAENERMHLMTALQLRRPTKIFRLGVVVSQDAFVTMFSLAYLISPRFCHRFVGYLEEEAVITYTKCVQDIHHGSMQHWKTQSAPESAITYWKLPDNAKMLDVILAIRADEAHHRVVNHTLASLKEDDYNPYKPGK
ncbi:uncharacterized protein LOC127736893 [Mytilus californianus]|uniref:uncharacterized protein LOC127736893 n=1 Tax=Mytilus californianus TaxID=6549 RepID=UPI002245D7DB|nr:uncharacterized protein LOC127736893 [Mytilus californianus]